MLFPESADLPLTMLGAHRTSELALDRPGAARIIGFGARDGARFELLCVHDRGLLVSLLHGSPWMELLIGLAAKDCRYTVH